MKVGSDEVAAVILEQVGKDQRCERMMGSSEFRRNAVNDGDDTQATSKQISYLKRLGVEVTAGLTKQQASELIDEAMAK